MNKQNKKNKNRKGFTLIELIVVIAILAILAAVAIPNFVGLTKRAQTATEVAAATEYVNAINVFNALQTADANKITASNIGTDLSALNNKLDDLAPQADASITPSHIIGRISFNGNLAYVSNKEAITD